MPPAGVSRVSLVINPEDLSPFDYTLPSVKPPPGLSQSPPGHSNLANSYWHQLSGIHLPIHPPTSTHLQKKFQLKGLSRQITLHFTRNSPHLPSSIFFCPVVIIFFNRQIEVTSSSQTKLTFSAWRDGNYKGERIWFHRREAEERPRVWVWGFFSPLAALSRSLNRFWRNNFTNKLSESRTSSTLLI